MTRISLASIFLASVRYSSAWAWSGFKLDHRLAVDFGPLDHVVAGDEMDHLGAQLSARA
jgi:hypothetical protein